MCSLYRRRQSSSGCWGKTSKLISSPIYRDSTTSTCQSAIDGHCGEYFAERVFHRLVILANKGRWTQTDGVGFRRRQMKKLNTSKVAGCCSRRSISSVHKRPAALNNRLRCFRFSDFTHCHCCTALSVQQIRSTVECWCRREQNTLKPKCCRNKISTIIPS